MTADKPLLERIDDLSGMTPDERLRHRQEIIDRALADREDVQYIEGVGVVPRRLMVDISPWPKELGLECCYCKHKWLPMRRPKACPRCKRYFWKGRYPLVIPYTRRAMFGKIPDPEPDEHRSWPMIDLNLNQMFDIHLDPCSSCGKKIPRGVLDPRTKEFLCSECAVKRLDATEAGTMIGLRDNNAQHDVPEYEHPWELDPEENVPDFGVTKVVDSGTCSHCGGDIKHEAVQEAEDGSLYCSACLSWYVINGELPSDEVMQARRENA
ncbi:hypothetical protein D4R42_04405 [bacterium]|nr:MAG: hypothetical protein D4R42_04405 [bacterium]